MLDWTVIISTFLGALPAVIGPVAYLLHARLAKMQATLEKEAEKLSEMQATLEGDHKILSRNPGERTRKDDK